MDVQQRWYAGVDLAGYAWEHAVVRVPTRDGVAQRTVCGAERDRYIEACRLHPDRFWWQSRPGEVPQIVPLNHPFHMTDERIATISAADYRRYQSKMRGAFERALGTSSRAARTSAPPPHAYVRSHSRSRRPLRRRGRQPSGSRGDPDLADDDLGPSSREAAAWRW